MARKKKQTQTLDELMAMAQRYHVDTNAMFCAAAEQYATQQRVIRRIRDTLDEADKLTVEKSYQKDAFNSYANPLIRELPKHADSANKTLSMMLDIIAKLGHEDAPQDDLSEFLEE